jgi:hypothetical protein
MTRLEALVRQRRTLIARQRAELEAAFERQQQELADLDRRIAEARAASAARRAA